MRNIQNEFDYSYCYQKTKPVRSFVLTSNSWKYSRRVNPSSENKTKSPKSSSEFSVICSLNLSDDILDWAIGGKFGDCFALKFDTNPNSYYCNPNSFLLRQYYFLNCPFFFLKNNIFLSSGKTRIAETSYISAFRAHAKNAKCRVKCLLVCRVLCRVKCRVFWDKSTAPGTVPGTIIGTQLKRKTHKQTTNKLHTHTMTIPTN